MFENILTLKQENSINFESNLFLTSDVCDPSIAETVPKRLTLSFAETEEGYASEQWR